MTGPAGTRPPGRNGTSGGGYSFLNMAKDVTLFSIFALLLLMNYMNMNVLHVLDGSDPISLHLDPSDSQLTRRNTEASKSSIQSNKQTVKHKPGARGPRISGIRQKKIPQSIQQSEGQLLIQEDDIVYKGGINTMYEYDSAPIVDEEHKLLFFSTPKVACTTFKFLFRKIAGVKEWDYQDGVEKKNLPHNPKHNNLKYLWDYPIDVANRMMTDPEWTRAIFVRDPKTRFLSAFLDKAVGNYGSFVTEHCCSRATECRNEKLRIGVLKAIKNCQIEMWDPRKNAISPRWLEDQPCCDLFQECQERTMNVEGFLETIETCQNSHWDPQSNRIEAKYWKYINFVGRMESINEDTEKLLKRVGAWEKYGKTGWGPNRDQSIIEASGGSQSHKTNSESKIYQWFTPEKERLVEEFYKDDYRNPALNFTITNLTLPAKDGKLLKFSDNIYRRDDWDGSPIVVAKYKLIFFTIPKVGATRWKQAFRRMERLADWRKIGGDKGLPHNPNDNGLKYLVDYSVEDAEAMMTSPEWTKAIFVRSPKDRALSVYSQMANQEEEIDRRCCPHSPGCSSAMKDMVQFVGLMKTCFCTHWAPYSERFDEKWWKYITFIGRLETIDVDAEKLLRSIGAWEEIGMSGWGDHGDQKIFVKEDGGFESVHKALGKYNPEADKLLEAYYKADYESPYLNFTSRKVHVLQ